MEVPKVGVEEDQGRGDDTTDNGDQSITQCFATLKKTKFMEVQNVVLKHVTCYMGVGKAALCSLDPREFKENCVQA